MGGLDKLVDRLLATFASDLGARVATLQEALRAGDPEAVVSPAHALKGAAGTVRAERLHRLCGAIEASARDGRQLDGAEEALAVCAEELEKALTAEVG